ncbi:MAG: hypothetical protein JWQ71_1761 [Pedosphaera sp.]|nr:hypothetical protein [Pedosphaera sp.]
MSINGSSEKTAETSRGRPDGGFLGLLHKVGLIAVVAGAMCSVGLMLWVGHRNPSRLLLALFAIWVLCPFLALLLANIISKRWSVIIRATLYSVMLVLTLGSLAIYSDVVLRPRSTPAFMFIVVPLGSWLFMTIAVSIAALISGRLSRRGASA